MSRQIEDDYGWIMNRLVFHSDFFSWCMSLLAYLGQDNLLLSVEIRTSIIYGILTVISVLAYITSRRLSLNRVEG